MSLYKAALTYYGISDTNAPLNRDMLLDGLRGGLRGYSEGDIKAIVNILYDNPERDKDKKAIMRKTGRESSINTTTGQGLGSVIDNMPYYVDSSAWWIKGFNSDKYLAAKERASKGFRASYIDKDKLTSNGSIRTLRKYKRSKVAKFLKDKQK